MEYKFQYNSVEERQNIMNENSNKLLLEDQQYFTDKFLVFGDEPRPKVILYENVPKDELDNLQNQVLEMQSYIVDQEFKNLLNTGGM